MWPCCLSELAPGQWSNLGRDALKGAGYALACCGIFGGYMGMMAGMVSIMDGEAHRHWQPAAGGCMMAACGAVCCGWCWVTVHGELPLRACED